jgi:hypothetical protein
MNIFTMCVLIIIFFGLTILFFKLKNTVYCLYDILSNASAISALITEILIVLTMLKLIE